MMEINFALPYSAKNGLFTNYLGFTLFYCNVGLVRTLLNGVFMISSSWFLFHEEVVKIKHCLEKKLLSPKFS